jgi:hypothetical protein
LEGLVGLITLRRLTEVSIGVGIATLVDRPAELRNSLSVRSKQQKTGGGGRLNNSDLWMTLMSLTVAHQLPNDICIVTETKLTDPKGETRAFHEGGLKAILLNRWLCVCLAGNYRVARGAIVSLAPVPEEYDLKALEDHLLGHQTDHEGEVEFLIASLKPLSLSKISKARIERSPACWIGDQTAFEAFQRYYHGLRTARSTREHETRMRTALDGVIQDGSVPSVGQIVITVRPTGGGFVYPPHIASTTERPQIISGRTELKFGGVEEGAFSYSVLGARQPGIGAIGIHFRESLMGAFFYPVELEEPEIIRGVDVNQFVDETRTKYGIQIDGIRLY